MSRHRGTTFLKMSGSGNDFIVFDVRGRDPGDLATPEVIRSLCARGVGVGADGVVLVGDSNRGRYGMRYFNADGSEAALCGNATLCTARLGMELGIVGREEAASGFQFETGVGVTNARILAGRPEIVLAAAEDLRRDVSRDVALAPGELRMGYVVIGVPHVVILCEDAESVRLMERGSAIRRDRAFPHGANVNFVSREDSAWRYRTYERGVENETLACGTGAAACAMLLREWGDAGAEVDLLTTSGSILSVSLGSAASDAPWLRGDARIVYRGELNEI